MAEFNCEVCGSELTPGVSNCPVCGSEVKLVTVPSEPEVVPEVPQEEKQESYSEETTVLTGNPFESPVSEPVNLSKATEEVDNTNPFVDVTDYSTGSAPQDFSDLEPYGEPIYVNSSSDGEKSGGAGKGLCIAGMITGICSFICCIPFLSTILAIAAVILSIIGLKNTGKNAFSIVGLITGGIGLLLGLILIVATFTGNVASMLSSF